MKIGIAIAPKKTVKTDKAHKTLAKIYCCFAVILFL